MKHKLLMILGLTVTMLTTLEVNAGGAGGVGGGGDPYVADFAAIHNNIFLWMSEGNFLSKEGADAQKFLFVIQSMLASNPKKIQSTNDINVTHGFDCYYNVDEDIIYINRLKWNEPKVKKLQWRLVAHEVFRKMGLEDDAYQISSYVLTDKLLESAFGSDQTLKIQEGFWHLFYKEKDIITPKECVLQILHGPENDQLTIYITQCSGLTSMEPISIAVCSSDQATCETILPLKDTYENHFSTFQFNLFPNGRLLWSKLYRENAHDTPMRLESLVLKYRGINR